MNYYQFVDYTLLKPNAKWSEFCELCEKAISKKVYSVCIPPNRVKSVSEQFPQLRICTVVGFPNGNNTLETKVFEAKQAIKNGADEVDMVINIGALFDDDFTTILNEINEVKRAIGDKFLKVIVETSYIKLDEIAVITEKICESNCDFIKTSTGFSEAGADLKKTKIMVDVSRGRKKIKASGGIRNYETFKQYIDMGCNRIGVSNIDYLE